MILLNGVVTFAGTLISWKIENKNKDFFILFFMLSAGVFGTFSSLDLFFFFFFYELAVLPMYLLIGVWGSSSRFPTFMRTKEYSALKLMMMLVGGSRAHLHRHLRDLHRSGPRHLRPAGALRARPDGGFDTELPEVGLPAVRDRRRLSGRPLALPHLVARRPRRGADRRLDAARRRADEAGRVRYHAPRHPAVPRGRRVLDAGAHRARHDQRLYGAISAMAQTDFKYVIGYSVVSHMGYVLMGLATLDPVGVNGAALQMFSHGVMTALMFAMVGAVYDQAHTRELAVFGGLASKMPRFAVVLHRSPA